MKARAQVKKRKATAKRNKKKNEALTYKSRYPEPDKLDLNEGPGLKKDSVYSFKNESKQLRIWIVLIRESGVKDSLSYFYLENENDISDEDKKNARNYLKVTDAKTISGVQLKGLVPKEVKGRHARSIAKYRSKKLLKFLMESDIRKEIIRIETPE